MTVDMIELEEEEHTSNLTMPVFRRIVSLLKPHRRWVAGFLVSIATVSALDSLLTYLNKEIVDQGITAANPDRVMQIAMLYGAFILVQSILVFGFIYLAGVLG